LALNANATVALLRSVATSVHRSRSGAKRTRYARRETYRSCPTTDIGHERLRRVAVLMSMTPDEPESQARIAALAQGLQEADGRDHWMIQNNSACTKDLAVAPNHTGAGQRL
jgi:hypothetical protein